MLNEKHRYYGQTKKIDTTVLKTAFNSNVFKYLDVVLLFGSRATTSFHPRSDYDFAVAFQEAQDDEWGTLSKVWSDIGDAFSLNEIDYDVIDLMSASSQMKSSIKEGYIILKGDSDDISRILG